MFTDIIGQRGRVFRGGGRGGGGAVVVRSGRPFHRGFRTFGRRFGGGFGGGGLGFPGWGWGWGYPWWGTWGYPSLGWNVWPYTFGYPWSYGYPGYDGMTAGMYDRPGVREAYVRWQEALAANADPDVVADLKERFEALLYGSAAPYGYGY
jgi:hypothetical protein